MLAYLISKAEPLLEILALQHGADYRLVAPSVLPFCALRGAFVSKMARSTLQLCGSILQINPIRLDAKAEPLLQMSILLVPGEVWANLPSIMVLATFEAGAWSIPSGLRSVFVYLFTRMGTAVLTPKRSHCSEAWPCTRHDTCTASSSISLFCSSTAGSCPTVLRLQSFFGFIFSRMCLLDLMQKRSHSS